MTKEELLAKIKAEIERRKGICTAQIKANPEQTFPFVMEITEYDKILSFLSTIKSEKPINQERLDENIKHYIEDCGWEKDSTIPVSFVRQIASHFYDLGCRRTAEKYDEIEYNRQRAEESVPNDLEDAAIEYSAIGYSPFDDPYEKHQEFECSKFAFISGAKWQKEQMMKEAVEMEAGMFGKHLPMLIVTEPMEMKDFPAKHGQTVRVIVLPKDDSHE